MRLILFAGYELLVLAAAGQLVMLLQRQPTATPNPRATVALATLLVAFMINGSLAFAITVAGVNHWATYLAVAAILCAGVAAAGRRRRPARRWWELVGRAPVGVATPALVLGGALFTTFAYLSAYINRDIDTTHTLSYLVLWSRNEANPYQTLIGQTGYPEFVETNYLPALVLGDSIAFAPLVSVMTVGCIWLATYLLLNHLGVARTPAFLASISQVLMWHFLAGSATGIPSIKSDMALTAGVLTLAVAGLRVLRGEADRLTAVLATAGIVFATAKYSGIGYVAVWMLIVAVLGHRVLLARRGPVLVWGGVTLLALLLTTGHYYVRNLLVFGTPLWPTTDPLFGSEAEVLGASLFTRAGEEALIGPGLWDQRLSILSHISERALWDQLVQYAHYGGFWFLATFVAGLLLPLVAGAAWLGFRLAGRASDLGRGHLFAATLAWLSFMLFINTPFTAGSGGEDAFNLIANLGNFRYGMAAFVMIECLAFAVLWKVVSGSPAVFGAVAGIAVGARAQAYYELSYIGVLDGLLLSMLAGLGLTGLVIGMARASRSPAVRRRVPPATAAAAALGLGILWPVAYEKQQPKEWAAWLPAYDRFWDSDEKRIGLAADTGSIAPLVDATPHPTFGVVAGRELQNEIVTIDQSLPADDLRGLDYVVWLEHAYRQLPLEASTQFAQDAERKGFVVEHVDETTVVARRAAPP